MYKRQVYPLPLAVSAAYGLLIAIAFALPPLAATRHIPAAGLYRATVDGAGRIEKRVLAAVALAFAAIVALAVGTAREPLFALGFIGAVSYTHLDVYKRQERGGPAGSPLFFCAGSRHSRAMRYTIDALLTGKARRFGAKGEPSAIDKRAVEGRRAVGALGIAGDEQADLSVHGGPDKAIHHYPRDHYGWWAETIGDHALLQDAGAFGENISTSGLTESCLLYTSRCV